jgi:DHA1 family tetracycline resistance protein-like MFS transporter
MAGLVVGAMMLPGAAAFLEPPCSVRLRSGGGDFRCPSQRSVLRVSPALRGGGSPGQGSAMCAAATPAPQSDGEEEGKRRAVVLSVWLTVFVHMLGVGITLSQLSLYLTALGASPTQLGLAIAGFSGAQMIGSPLLVALSERVGRRPVLLFCLAGNAVASLLTASMATWEHIALVRLLAGFFAASVPVSQAAVTDLVAPGPDMTKALGQVAAASSLGIVAGPAVAGMIAEIAARAGAPTGILTRIVFAASGIFAGMVCLYLAITGVESKPAAVWGAAAYSKASASHTGNSASAQSSAEGEHAAQVGTRGHVQLLVRWIAFITSWTATLLVSTYSLFATRFLGYTQANINASQSASAAVAVCVQLWLVPRMCKALGDERACTAGLGILGSALCACCLVWGQPQHVILFMAVRVGLALAETTNAALTAANSSPATRARNLGLLQSTQAGGRIISPLIAGWLYQRYTSPEVLANAPTALVPPASVAFLLVATLAMLTAPLPLLLRRDLRQKKIHV